VSEPGTQAIAALTLVLRGRQNRVIQNALARTSPVAANSPGQFSVADPWRHSSAEPALVPRTRRTEVGRRDHQRPGSRRLPTAITRMLESRVNQIGARGPSSREAPRYGRKRDALSRSLPHLRRNLVEMSLGLSRQSLSTSGRIPGLGWGRRSLARTCPAVTMYARAGARSIWLIAFAALALDLSALCIPLHNLRPTAYQPRLAERGRQS
jgi:hypothetical protein